MSCRPTQCGNLTIAHIAKKKKGFKSHHINRIFLNLPRNHSKETNICELKALFKHYSLESSNMNAPNNV